MSWIENLRPPKFYRYMFYLQYKFSRSLWDNDAQFSALVGTALTLMAQFVFLIVTLSYVLKISFVINLLKNVGPHHVLICSFFFLGLSYLLFYKNDKWVAIINEFQHLREETKQNGNFYFFLYLFFCFFLAFYPIFFKIFLGIDLSN